MNRLRDLKEMVRDAADSINDVWDEILDDEMKSIQITIDELEDEVKRILSTEIYCCQQHLDTKSLLIQEDGCPDLKLLNALRRVLIRYGSDDHFIEWMNHEIKKYPCAPATGYVQMTNNPVIDPILNLEDIKWV